MYFRVQSQQNASNEKNGVILQFCDRYTVKLGYNEHGYNEFTAITNIIF